MDQAISIIGLGKLGSPIAACFAARGFRVLAADLDRGRVEAIGRGEAPVVEPGLPEMLRQAGGRLTATTSVAEATAATDVTFVIVPTPTGPDGGFELRHVLSACGEIGRGLRDQPNHLVVITSTVMPGATGGPIRAALEQASGKRAGTGFGLCYSPEFVALGSVIRDFLHPDFLLIGESDPAAGARLEAIARAVVNNQPAVARTNWVNAELAKLAVNTFVTTKISFANLLARICEQLPGADVDVVTAALGLDSRIGRKYLKGAIGYGGPCFPRDNLAMAALARGHGVAPTLPEATDRMNREQVGVIHGLITRRARPGATIGLLGLAYKADTDVVEESQAVILARLLAADGWPVLAFDPLAMDGARRLLGDKIGYVGSLDECVRRSDVLVVTTPWPAFREIDPALFAARPTALLIDCWRVLDAPALAEKLEYIPLGVSFGGNEQTGRQ